MQVIKTTLQEVYGLFVEDGSYALSIIVWLLVAGLLLPRLAVLGIWRGPVLFAGLLVILIESVVRAARK